MMDEDWQVIYSLSLLKTLSEFPKLKASGPKVCISLKNVPTSTIMCPGPRISTNLENDPTSTNSHRAKLLVDRWELPMQVKKVLWKSNCAGVSLTDNQMRVLQ